MVFLKREFQLLRKDSMTIMEYLNKIKIITDQLAVIGCAVSDNDMVQQTLSGLGSDYNMIVTSLLCLPVLPTFDELRAKLIQYEMTLKRFSEETHNHPNTQEVLTTGVTYGKGWGQGGQGRSGHGGRGLLPTPNMSAHAQGPRFIPTCFLCNKKGHIKANCWHNPENKGNGPQTETKRKFTNTRDSGEIKDLLISALSELKLKQSDEGTWFVDSGAATHVLVVFHARVMYCLSIPLIRELQNLLRLFVLMCGDPPQLSLGLEADII